MRTIRAVACGVLGAALLAATLAVPAAAALPTMSIDDVTAAEPDSGTTSFVFTVTLSSASAQTVTVRYVTVGTSAHQNVDYEFTEGTLTFAATETTKNITVRVYGEYTFEPDETFYVNLSSPTNATIVRSQGRGSILNDDYPAPSLAIDDVTHAEGDSGTTGFEFTVTKTGPTELPSSVAYTVVGTSAAQNVDYAHASGTLTFAVADTAKTITVTVYGDTTLEQDEVFWVNLSGATNGVIWRSQGKGTIVNDDAAVPNLSITDVAQAEGDSGATAFTFTVSRTSSAGSASVHYGSVGGTAVEGVDYAAASGQLSFAPGVSTQTVEVQVTGDVRVEADETFAVVLSAPAGAQIGDGSAVGTIVNDDIETTPPEVSLVRPRGGLYLLDVELGGLSFTVVVGAVTVRAKLADPETGICSQQFIVDGEPVPDHQTSFDPASGDFTFKYAPTSLGPRIIEVTARNCAYLEGRDSSGIVAVPLPVP